MSIKEQYALFTEKYDFLPNYQELNHVLELEDYFASQGYEPNFLLRHVRRRIVNILDSWTNYLHNIVMPGNSSMIMYEESNHFTQEEKDTIVKQMTNIMQVSRQTVMLELQQEEQKDARFITDAMKFYAQVRQELLPITEKSLNIWKEQAAK